MMGESVSLSGESIEQNEPESSLETYRFGVSMGALIVVGGGGYCRSLNEPRASCWGFVVLEDGFSGLR